MSGPELPGRPVCRIVPTEQLRACFEAVRDSGAVAQTTLVLPNQPWFLRERPITCVSELRSEHDVISALIALLRGAALVVSVHPDLPGSAGRDLARLADVQRLDQQVPVPLPLSEDQRQILALLADGRSLPDVATELYLSLRTAERRLSAARRLLGVRSTAEALVVVATMGRSG